MIGYHSHSACLHAVFANMNLKLVTRFDNDFYVGPIMPRRFLRDRNRLSVSIKVNLGAGYFQSVPVHHKTASFTGGSERLADTDFRQRLIAVKHSVNLQHGFMFRVHSRIHLARNSSPGDGKQKNKPGGAREFSEIGRAHVRPPDTWPTR